MPYCGNACIMMMRVGLNVHELDSDSPVSVNDQAKIITVIFAGMIVLLLSGQLLQRPC